MIAEILQKGARNRMTTGEIQRRLNLSQRDVVAIVSEERAKGYPIISSSKGGYYLPSDNPALARQELTDCINTCRQRAYNTLKATEPLKKALKELELQEKPRQMTLEDVGLSR